MANYYVDSNTGSNSDNGTTQALAWATLEYAMELGNLNAGDIVWIRRTHDEDANIAAAYSGTANNPISYIGWPRAAIPDTTITSATWTNGSTTVDLVVGVTLSKAAHCGRYVTAPNGAIYLITRIIDTNTLIIDREYSGSTVTSTDGKFQIEADEDYSTRPTDIDGWDSDAHALALLDFTSSNRFYMASVRYYRIKNLDIRAVTGSQYFEKGTIIGCLISKTGDYPCAYLGYTYMKRCIVTGNSTGTNQAGVQGRGVIIDSAIYDLTSGTRDFDGYLENVNIGVEVVNASRDIYVFDKLHTVYGRDVKLGSTTKVSYRNTFYTNPYGVFRISIENYQKILGNHKEFIFNTERNSKDVVAGSGDPYKRSGGADKIIEIDCSNSSTLSPSTREHASIVFTHEFETDTTSKSYRYYVQCKDLSLTADELWLEVEYVDSYDDTSEYTITKEVSDEACSLRSGVSDWSQYIEVTGVQPAVASKVRIRCFVAKYDSDGYIYIDPKVVIT